MSDNQQNYSNRLNKILARRKQEPGFWRELWQQARLVYRLIRDPNVPLYLKLLPFFSLLYLIFPFDLIPDMAPIIGQVDDLAILVAFSKIFIELSPQDVVKEHLTQIQEEDGTVIINQMVDERDPVSDAIVIGGQNKEEGQKTNNG
jgi:uncharacterized membrane protein YkvA (DUF1232 family)